MGSIIFRFLLIYSAMSLAWVACWRVPVRSWVLRNPLLASITLGLITEVTAMAAVWLSFENSIVYNVCVPLEFLVLLWLLYRFKPRWRRVLLLAAFLGCTSMFIAAMLRDPTAFVLTEAVVVISMILTALLVAALWSIAKTSESPLPSVPEFWLFMGLLVYFGGLVPHIAMVRFVFQKNSALAAELSFIMPLLCILRYLCTAGACLLQARIAGSRQHE